MDNKNIVLSFTSLQIKKPKEGDKCLIRTQNFYDSNYDYDVLTWHNEGSPIWSEPKILEGDSLTRLLDAVLSEKPAPKSGFYKINITDNGLDEVLALSESEEFEWAKLD